jgi:NAD(P)-dependent dehydrogenase (short-subunit alcohol dehydrogenase family)
LRREHPHPHRFDSVDVADDARVADWARDVCETLGVPDLVVNNAALINVNAALWRVPPEEFQRVVDVNLVGTYQVIRHFVPAMITAGRGVVANFSSGWGRSTAPEVGPYCATKWAIEGLTRSLAQELPPGLAAVSVNPGIVRTAMLESCFGEGAAIYPDPSTWAERADPFLLGIGPEHNGQALTVPG